MCPRPKIEEDMDVRTFMRTVDDLDRHKSRSISLHLFGEPLLDEELLTKIDILKFNKHNVILTTNGTINTPAVFDAVDHIIITYRPGLNLETKEEWRYKITLRCFKDYHIPKGWRVERKPYHNYGGNVKGEGHGTSREWYPCYHLWLAPAIAWNGDILICCNDPHHKTKLGNIKDMGLSEAWTSAKMKSLRCQQLKGITEGICSNCNCWQTYPDMWFKWQKK